MGHRGRKGRRTRIGQFKKGRRKDGGMGKKPKIESVCSISDHHFQHGDSGMYRWLCSETKEIYESDTFFRNVFEQSTVPLNESTTNSDLIEDPLSADEHFVVLNKIFQHEPCDDLDAIKSLMFALKYSDLKKECIEIREQSGYGCLAASKYIRFVQLYEESALVNPVIKVCVTVSEDYTVYVMVHGVPLPSDHEVWARIPTHCKTSSQVKAVINLLSEYTVCPGNPDSQYQHLILVSSHLENAKDDQRAGYRETFCTSTIRSTKCPFLIKSKRCMNCSTYRRTLSKSMSRERVKIATSKVNWITSKKANDTLTDPEKMEKLKQLRKHCSGLQTEVDRLNRQLNRSLRDHGTNWSEGNQVQYNPTEAINRFTQQQLKECKNQVTR